MRNWQKAVKYGAMAFAIFIIVSIVSGILGVAGIFLGAFGEDDILEDSRTYEVSQTIHSLEMEMEAADIAIVTGETLKVESNLKQLTVTEKDGVLHIEQEDLWFGGYAYTDKKKLVLYVPEDYCFSEADISAGAGRLTVEYLEADTLSLDLGAGKTEIENLVVSGRAELEGGAGQLLIRDGSLQNLEFEMGVGEAVLCAQVLGNSKISCGVGKADITLKGGEDTYVVHIEKGLGKATVDGQNMEDNSTYGGGTNRIEIEGGVGTVRVAFEELPANE